MKPHLGRIGPAFVVVAIGAVLSSCGPTPSAPTAPPASEASVSGMAPGTGTSLAGMTTTWSCLTAGTTGIVVAGCATVEGRLGASSRVGAAAVPGPAVNLSAVVTGSTVTLNWSASAGATSYIVEAGSSSGASNLASFDTGNPAVTLTVTAVPSGTYFVRVRGKNSDGVSAPSNEIVVTIGGTPPPPSPPPGPPTPSGPITGRWIGLVANGDGYVQAPLPDPRRPQCGPTKFDAQVDLTQTGNTVTGTTTTRVTAATCDQVGRVQVDPVSFDRGLVDSRGAFSTTENGTFNDGSRYIFVTAGTFTATRLTFTQTLTVVSGPQAGGGPFVFGTFAANKQ